MLKKDIFNKIIKFIKKNKVKSFFILVGCILLININWILLPICIFIIFISKKYKDKKIKDSMSLNLDTKDNKVGILVGVFIVLMFGWIFISNSNDNTPKIEKEKIYDNIDVCIKSKRLLVNFLKAPSTAEFPDCGSFIIISPEKNKFIVNSYVDSQNSIGAMLRSRWIMSLHIEKGESVLDDKIIIDSLTIDGEKMI